MRRQRPDNRTQPKPRVRLMIGDTVEVLCGKERDRGKRGQVTEIMARQSRVRVAGINLQIKHQKGGRRRTMQQQAGRIQLPGPIHISNVQLVCTTCGQRTRPKYEVTETPERVYKRRICGKCGAEIARQRVEQ